MKTEDEENNPIDDVFDKRYFISDGDVYVSEEERIQYVDEDDLIGDFYDDSKCKEYFEEVYSTRNNEGILVRIKRFFKSLTNRK